MEWSALKSYVTVLSDGRVWKRHVDHLCRREPSSDESPCQTAEPKDSVVSTDSKTDDNATIQVEEGHEQLPSVAQAQSSEIT